MEGSRVHVKESSPSLGHVAVADPWLSRFCSSQLQQKSSGPAGCETISTSLLKTFGKASNPVRFNIGNGGAGYTGILQRLAETYISGSGDDFRIGWVSNHSRHSQVALLADVVQLALTYEPENEKIATNEGWAVRIGKAFNDHFILVGPDNFDVDARSPNSLLQAILAFNSRPEPKKGDKRLIFHSRGKCPSISRTPCLSIDNSMISSPRGRLGNVRERDVTFQYCRSRHVCIR